MILINERGNSTRVSITDVVDGSQGWMSSIPHLILIYLSTRRLLQFGGINVTSEPGSKLFHLPVAPVQCCYVPVCIYQWPQSNAVMCLSVFTSDPSQMLLCACLHLPVTSVQCCYVPVCIYQHCDRKLLGVWLTGANECYRGICKW